MSELEPGITRAIRSLRDREDPLHLTRYVLGFDVHDRSQGIESWKSTTNRSAASSRGAVQSGHRLGDPGVEVVLLVQGERIEQALA